MEISTVVTETARQPTTTEETFNNRSIDQWLVRQNIGHETGPETGHKTGQDVSREVPRHRRLDIARHYAAQAA